MMQKISIYILSLLLTVTLYAKEKNPKKYYFKFVDNYAKIEKKKKDEVFNYENKSRFQFKFQSSLAQGSNRANPGGGSGSGGGASSGAAGGGGGQGAGGAGHGGGGHGGGGRR